MYSLAVLIFTVMAIGLIWLGIRQKKKPQKANLHQVRAKAIALLADEPDICRKEIIESLIAEYLPDMHLHKDPNRKRLLL
jgi:hypothetical protein